jgi:hypothetical protein
MNMDHLQQFIDLRRTDIHPEVFAAATAIHYVNKLIASGGSNIGRLDLESVLPPQQIEVFLFRAISTAQKTKRFDKHEWRSLQQAIPHIKIAWENGQAHFQENLARAMDNPEEMEYLSQIDFAADCYAYAAALKTCPHDAVLQAWYINGYMLAWQRHFFSEDSNSAI